MPYRHNFANISPFTKKKAPYKKYGPRLKPRNYKTQNIMRLHRNNHNFFLPRWIPNVFERNTRNVTQHTETTDSLKLLPMYFGVGQRKEAKANVFLKGTINFRPIISINNKPIRNFCQGNIEYIQTILLPLTCVKLERPYDIFIQTSGGGLKGQVCAIRHALAVCLTFTGSRRTSHGHIRSQEISLPTHPHERYQKISKSGPNNEDINLISNNKKLLESGLLGIDIRKKERKKYGLRKSRKAPQFSKR
jgi:small subunit ribosomal protein S9